jgi:hypothetical protein
VNGFEASARWGCSHAAPDACPWCSGTDAEVWRSVDGYVPVYGFPTVPVVVEAPTTSLTLAEWVDKNFNGFFERGAS